MRYDLKTDRHILEKGDRVYIRHTYQKKPTLHVVIHTNHLYATLDNRQQLEVSSVLAECFRARPDIRGHVAIAYTSEFAYEAAQKIPAEKRR